METPNIDTNPFENPNVIQNSDVLYKSDIKWTDDITYIEPNAFEIEMLADTKSARQMIDEELSESKLVKTEEEIKKQKTKDLLLMFKVISLARMDYHPLSNTSLFQPEPLKAFLVVMNNMVEEYNRGLEADIILEFNKVCLEKLFIGPDVSNYPVYS